MTYSKARRNPYIIGRPINEDEPGSFVGRESLFHFIEDNLKQDEKVILLHGQRRIGKSSLLRHIPEFVAPDEFTFVFFDLEYHSQEPLSCILDALITEIIDRFELDSTKIARPSTTELETDPYIFSHQFLPQVYEALGGKKLVLLLDEFDALSNDNSDSVVEHLFPYLRSIIALQDKLFIILCVGRQSEDMPNLLGIFKEAPIQEIGLLDELSGKRLIQRPAQGVLEYEPEAIQAILELSAGHPYFTQIICFVLFARARELQNWKVSREDVEGIVDKAIESAGGGLAWFWDGLSIPERLVISAVAEAQKIAIEKDQRVPEEPLTVLKNYGVPQTETLIHAAKQLAEKGFLDNTGRKVKVELVRRWLVQRYPLRQEIKELGKLEQEEVNPLGEVANKRLQQGKAVKLYLKADQIDPIGQQREFTLAEEQEQDNRVLRNEPGNPSPKQNSEEIETSFEPEKSLILTGQKDSAVPHSPVIVSSKYSSQYRRKLTLLLGGIAAAAGTIALVGIGVSRWSTPCAAGEQKVLGITCVAEPSNISRGERTLFPFIGNTNRDLGVEAFKQGKYSEAVKYFEKAVAANRNDPEVLIYYNNARAQQQGSPLTLAAVVPVDKTSDSAQEILRGVAQAQNQFNNSGGFKPRLLEIAIANDGNEPSKAKEVAQKLVTDSSVLGVIGHDSSEDSMAGLAEYEKASLAIISPTSTSTSLTRNSNVFFRTVPSDAVAGKKLAEYARKSLRLDKVVIFYNPNSVYSNSLQDAFRNNFEKLGGRVVQIFDLGTPNQNLTEAQKSDVAGGNLGNSIFRYNAKAALLFPDETSTSDALAIVKVNADLNTDLNNSKNVKQKELKLLGGDALYSENTLNKGGKGVEGLVLAVPWFNKAPQSKNFSKASEKLWGKPVSWRTATSFDATQAFINALSNNPSRSTVLQRLPKVNISSSQTSGKALQFTSKGERKIEPILIQVVGGGLSRQGSAFSFDIVKPDR